MTKGLFLGLTIIVALIAVQSMIAAWTHPTAPAPGGAVPTLLTEDPIFIQGSNVGIGIATPTSKLEVAGDINITGTGGALIFPDGTYIMTRADAIPAACLGVPGAAANCFFDVDGDGFTPARDDCDETCPSCYVGSTSLTPAPDVFDQNCNGVMNDIANTTTPCRLQQHIRVDLATAACAAYCENNGSIFLSFSCSQFNSCETEGWMDFASCTAGHWAHGHLIDCCSRHANMYCVCVGYR